MTYTVAAMITVSEIGYIHRFAHPRQLMAYLGLVPSEASSGERERRGSITKARNTHARRILVESGWTTSATSGWTWYGRS